jgi:hypothetical protein
MYTQKYTVEKEYIVPKDKFTEYLVLSISIFLFIIAWIIILYFAQGYKETNRSNTSTKSNSQSGDSGKLNTSFGNLQANPFYEICPAGECPTNIATGEKRCPVNPLQQMLFDPAYEVCNPVSACTNPRTPYAVLFDQSTNLEGVCNFAGCRCVNYAATPSFTQVIFQVQGGDLYASNPQLLDKWYLTQIPNTAVGQGNNIGMRYADPNTQFSTIAPSVLSKLSPQTTVCQNIYALGPEVTSVDTINCVNSNPCQNGKMAYILGYNQLFTNFDPIEDANTTPLGCVPAIVDNPINETDSSLDCFPGYAPVFNYMNGKIYCMPPTNN